MGFMGMGSISSSDHASDMTYTVLNNLAEELEEHSKKSANCYNTPGHINVGLFFKDIIVPCVHEHFVQNDELVKLAKGILPLIKAEKKEFDDEDLIKDIDEIVKSLESFIKRSKLIRE